MSTVTSTNFVSSHQSAVIQNVQKQADTQSYPYVEEVCLQYFESSVNECVTETLGSSFFACYCLIPQQHIELFNCGKNSTGNCEIHSRIAAILNWQWTSARGNGVQIFLDARGNSSEIPWLDATSAQPIVVLKTYFRSRCPPSCRDNVNVGGQPSPPPQSFFSTRYWPGVNDSFKKLMADFFGEDKGSGDRTNRIYCSLW